MVNFVTLFKAVDAAVALRAAIKQFKGGSAVAPAAASGETMVAAPQAGQQAIGGPIEARLTNVLVAALKEAFDRDRARLDLERIQLEEQRKRAEETLRIELRRQAAEHELGRLRLLAGTAMIGWIASVVMVAARLDAISTPGRAAIAAGWLLLLGALGLAFSAQRELATVTLDAVPVPETRRAGSAALWLLLAGLAVTAFSLLLRGG